MVRQPRRYQLKAQAGHIKIKSKVKMTVTRGPESWTYIYVMMGFAVAIEGTMISMISPLIWPYNVISFVLIGAITVYLFTSSAWFQNKLLGFRARYENKAR